MASQKIQGLNIKLSADTTAVASALKDIDKSLSGTQKELNQVDKLLKFDPKNTILLAQKQNLLSDAINGTRNKLEELVKIKELADQDDSVDKNTKEYRDLERQIEDTTQKLIKFEEKSKDTNVALKDASKSSSIFGETLKANLSAEAIIKSASLIVSAIKSIGKALLDTISETAEFADQVSELASKYNLSTQEIQTFIKTSELIDTDINTILKSFNKLTQAMGSESKGVIGAFKKLGVRTKESDGSLRDSNEVFYETIDALSQIQNETEQDSIAMQIFGKSASELGAFINGGAEDLKKYNEYLKENSLLLTDEELDSLNEFKDATDTLNMTLDSVKQKLVADLAPVITPLIDMITKFVVDHKDEIEELLQSIITDLTSGDGQKMFDNIKQVVEDIGTFLEDVPSIKESLEILAIPLKVIMSVLQAIVSAIKYIKENSAYANEARMYNIENYGTPGAFPGGLMHSGGFGALHSNGYGNQITLNANFTANGNLSEAQAMRFADLMVEQINERLGEQV